ncbi:hypothetical protein CERSUDRAFT_74109 [Gelatoporia subvermispora B]|uniref:DUF6533 domain-containing protein n=1 Tax=Ceriporiopsis subvermispora (strain B) TaxID=914234 RepID=M2QJ94_CERS8|nr:hypothetical protein CERSUDRAFT_74109 [Gelatoporia subvermispora B]
MSTSLENEAHLLSQAAQDFYRLNLSTAACIAWVVYDMILTSPQELMLVWRWGTTINASLPKGADIVDRTRFTFPKLLYIMTRYGGLTSLVKYKPNVLVYFATPPTSDSPIAARDGFGISLSFVDAAGKGLIMYRIYAVYGWTRKVLVILGGIWLRHIRRAGLNIVVTSVRDRPAGSILSWYTRLVRASDARSCVPPAPAEFTTLR